MRSRLLRAALFVGFGVGFAGPAWANLGDCSASATNVSFGSVSVSALSGATTVGTITASCPGNSTPYKGSTQIAWCNNIGAGGNSASQNNRTMKNGANAISYQLYSDSGYASPYTYVGSTFFVTPYSYAAGAQSTSYIYAKILSLPALLPPGTYTDTYTSGTQAAINSDAFPQNTVAFECVGTSGAHYWNAFPFTVSVTLVASCSVTATNINFGAVSVLQANTDATGTVSVTCTNTTPYQTQISYGNGTGAGGTGRQRYMQGSGGAQVNYNLYSDAGRSVIWGNNLGVDTANGIGNGSAQAYTVYARVPPQTTPKVGTYNDTVIVTVNY